MEEFLKWIKNFLSTTGLNILTALVILFLGLLIIKTVSRIAKTSLQRTAIEGATASFVVSILNFALEIILIFLVISVLFPNASAGLIAALGTAGLAIGLALQGSLANFANGIIIIFTKPFKEGDFVDIGGTSGKINSINILTTELLTYDNKKIVLSNTKVITSDITNYSSRPTRRVDLDVNVAYGSDMEKVKNVLSDIAKSHKKVLLSPEPLIRMSSHSESSIVFAFKVWTKTEDFWDVYFDLVETVYAEFQKSNISIPYRKLDVNIIQNKNTVEDKK